MSEEERTADEAAIAEVEEIAAAPEALPRYGLRAAGFRLLADTNVSVQVVDVPRMCPFPNAPPGFRGVFNLRGELVPVFDLGPLVDEQPAERGKLAVCGDGSERAALMVSGMPGRIPVEELEPAEPPPAASLPGPLATATHGASRHRDELWLEIDYAALFRALAEPVASDTAFTRVADQDRAEAGS